MVIPAIGWLVCAVVIITAAIRTRRHTDAIVLGRRATGVLYLVAGAGMNAVFLARGEDYRRFADGAYIAFVRHTWHTLVVPHHDAWITLLIVFELVVGALALLGGRRTQLAYELAIAFHVALLSFGWGFYAWSLPMIAAFTTLLRAERRTTPTAPPDTSAATSGANATIGVDLYWIPLGAGGHLVRFNGIVFEALSARWQHRPRCDIYHSALVIRLGSTEYAVEMTPVPDDDGGTRGVVAEGAVGLRALRRLRVFRYEVRRWPSGNIPDLQYAVASPIRVSDDPVVTGRIFTLLQEVPTPVWGRDELGAGEMWTCNSVISWVLSVAGIDMSVVATPTNARAPGWNAGRTVAARRQRVGRCSRRRFQSGRPSTSSGRMAPSRSRTAVGTDCGSGST